MTSQRPQPQHERGASGSHTPVRRSIDADADDLFGSDEELAQVAAERSAGGSYDVDEDDAEELDDPWRGGGGGGRRGPSAAERRVRNGAMEEAVSGRSAFLDAQAQRGRDFDGFTVAGSDDDDAQATEAFAARVAAATTTTADAAAAASSGGAQPDVA